MSIRRSRPHRRLGNARLRAGYALLLATSCLVGSARFAHAEGPAPVASEQERKVSAKAKYEQGVEAYRNERYADAVRSFLEADAISPSAALSYNIARAYEKLGDDAQTLRWYRNYLRLSPKAQNAAEVQKFIVGLGQALAKKGIQQVTVLSSPSGATAAVDGHPLGVTPLTVELSPGEHTVLLTLRDYSDATARFALSAATPLDVPVQLHPAPIQAVPPARDSAPDRGRRFGVAPYVTLGVGAVFLGAAGLFELERRSAQNSAQNEPVQLAAEQDINAMNSRQTTARVCLGIGGAVTVAGAALLVFNTRLGPDSRASLSGTPGGGTLLWERRF